jgi:peptide deformylase
MALREIRKDGDPVLRKIARREEAFGERLHTLLVDMAETMYDADGVGLAAPQIGVRRRVAVVDIGDGNLIELINPEVLESSGQACGQEGCLSIPGRSGFVRRPEYIKVKMQDREGNEVLFEAEGFLAVAMCHEMDHLDGILFTDKTVEPTKEELEALGLGTDDEEEIDELAQDEPTEMSS